MLARNAVQPYGLVSGVDLAVHDATLIVAVDPACLQAERPDQEVVSGLDVFIDEQRGDPLRIGYELNLVEDATAVLDDWERVSGHQALETVYCARRHAGSFSNLAVGHPRAGSRWGAGSSRRSRRPNVAQSPEAAVSAATTQIAPP